MPLFRSRASSLSLNTLALGNHTITAVYLNTDGHFSGSQGSLAGSQTIVTTATYATTAVTVAPSLSTFGQSVTLTATLTAGQSSMSPLNGLIQFQVDGTDFGSPVPSVNRVATISTSALAPGVHTITARFSGDGSTVLGSTTGTVITVAGNGTSGSSGDNGPATAAMLNTPPAWPWTPTATSTSPTRATTASARW